MTGHLIHTYQSDSKSHYWHGFSGTGPHHTPRCPAGPHDPAHTRFHLASTAAVQALLTRLSEESRAVRILGPVTQRQGLETGTGRLAQGTSRLTWPAKEPAGPKPTARTARIHSRPGPAHAHGALDPGCTQGHASLKGGSYFALSAHEPGAQGGDRRGQGWGGHQHPAGATPTIPVDRQRPERTHGLPVSSTGRDTPGGISDK